LTNGWLHNGALRGGLEVVLVSLLAIQAARLVWIVAESAAPLGIPPSAQVGSPDVDLEILARFNAFAPRQPEAVAANAPQSPMSLYGVRTGGKDGGSAIIAVAGAPQGVFGLGEEVEPGTVLKAVASDHVMLTRSGRNIKLPLLVLAGQASGEASVLPSYLLEPQKSQTQKSGGVAVDPKKFLEETGLLPRTENGKVTGYTVLPRGDAEALHRAGLQAGDVLISLNGTQITPQRYAELEQELASNSEVQITVQRGSETKTITLQTGR
jgi:general secretion pathway protein C